MIQRRGHHERRVEYVLCYRRSRAGDGRQARGPGRKASQDPRKRAGLIIGIIAAVLVLAYAGCCVAANALYSHTAFPNTSVLGMDMSGLSAQEAEQRWTEQGSALLDGMTIRLTRDGQEIGSTTLSDLGVTVLPVYISKAAGCDVQDRGWGSDVTASSAAAGAYRELVQGRGCHAPAGRGRGEAYPPPVNSCPTPWAAP